MSSDPTNSMCEYYVCEQTTNKIKNGMHDFIIDENLRCLHSPENWTGQCATRVKDKRFMKDTPKECHLLQRDVFLIRELVWDKI